MSRTSADEVLKIMARPMTKIKVTAVSKTKRGSDILNQRMKEEG